MNTIICISRKGLIVERLWEAFPGMLAFWETLCPTPSSCWCWIGKEVEVILSRQTKICQGSFQNLLKTNRGCPKRESHIALTRLYPQVYCLLKFLDLHIIFIIIMQTNNTSRFRFITEYDSLMKHSPYVRCAVFYSVHHYLVLTLNVSGRDARPRDPRSQLIWKNMFSLLNQKISRAQCNNVKFIWNCGW